jgi:Tfp pilus assembly protein PilN
MIRTNLSTRPFYNERIVRLSLLGLLILVLAATAFNVTRVLRYSRSDTKLSEQAARDESRAAELRASAVRLRATVDPRQIEVTSLEARRANDLIDRRTFSWTEVFNLLESTLPDEVRITSFRSKIEKGQIVLTITIVARGAEDVSSFLDNLEPTGVFADVGRTLEEHVNEQGQLLISLETVYRPTVGHTAGRLAGENPR